MNVQAGSHEAIEHASLDELRALQLTRLKWSLKHAYENVAHYRQAFDSAGVKPEQLRSLDDLANFPFLYKKDFRDNYPFGLFAVPREQVVRIHASSGTTGKPTVVGYTARDIDNWANSGSPFHSRRWRRPWGHRAYCVWIRALHRWARRALRRGKTGLHRGADVRRADRETGAAHPRFQAQHHHGDAVVHAHHRRGIRAAGIRSALLRHPRGDLRRRAVDRSHARADGGATRPSCSRCVWPVRSHGAWGRQRMRRDQGRTRGLGRSFLSRDHRSQSRARCCRTGKRASWCSHR